MPANYDKLKGLLRELFQMDQADLDFGIFRIMNAKRDEIERFLEHDLLPQVQEELARHIRADGGVKRVELEEAIEKAKALGVDPDQVPRVLELREQVKQGTDLAALENEVFSHLYNFFRRYYDQGDFLSLRRYKEGVYAIPYEGEEVKLYWANHDQYYIKSSEYLRNYAFKLPDGRRVHFKVAEADTEADNNKPQAGKERRFILAGSEPLVVTEGELIIRFEYRVIDRKQAELNAEAVAAILGDGNLGAWRMALAEARPTEKNKQRTLLEKHLSDFTAKNTFDYFIHKDLGGFLRRELDFFIKNEIMHLDDVEDEAAPKVELYLSKIKALRKIAHKVIAFLDQLETFQKKLWLKKKFVVETNYCVTIDRVPERFYSEILDNPAQLAEWKDVLQNQSVSVQTLKANPSLVLDTQHFSSDFKTRLEATGLANEGGIAGLLINGESFHALNLLQKRYKAATKCVYIDPPYNTGSGDFAYKDSYPHSSWITMARDRVGLSKAFIAATGLFWCSLDDHEAARARLLFDDIFGASRFIADIAVVNNLKGRQDKAHIATAHEHLILYAAPEAESYGLPMSQDRLQKFDEVDGSGHQYELRDLRRRGGGDRREDRPNMFFPIFWNPQTKSAALTRQTEADVEIIPKKSDGTDGRWRWGFQRVQENLSILEARPTPEGNKWNVYYRVFLHGKDGRTRTTKPKSIWLDPKYSTDVAGKTLKSLLPYTRFNNPKPIGLLLDILLHSAEDDDIVMDFTAGTGTTGQAVIELERLTGIRLKYILVEMANHFDSDLLFRLKKSIFSSSWDKGKPSDNNGVSHCIKYQRLESYDDCLSNLLLRRTGSQNDLLQRESKLREDYTLRYMLDVETQGSASLLNVQNFSDPFSYKLKVSTGTVGETKEFNVDLVETFNWLVGLKVKHIDNIRNVRVVEGTNPQGDRVLILWRNVVQVPNDKLDEWFSTQGYNTRDQEYDLIYVNGDNNLENLRREDQTWKVRLIEEDFHKLMWECQDV